LMMSLWDALRMNMMISYQELVRTFLSSYQINYFLSYSAAEKTSYCDATTTGYFVTAIRSSTAQSYSTLAICCNFANSSG
ncbi:hypothetical protein QMK87_27915, partial [Klebsiella pneumoniae]|uniref:hypothetical protein n=1 Tax=Klebsiella pneumoniae TaxID=573 RepID=UPI003A879B73